MNQAGYDLIKHYEGLRLTPYLCPGKVWTIGYGHTRTVRVGMVLTPEMADQFLIEDCKIAEASVKRLVLVPLNDNQLSALVAFTFNVGSGNLAASTMLRLLNHGWTDQVPVQFLRWNKAAGKVLPGLTARRKTEGLLWSLPVDDTAAASRSGTDPSSASELSASV